jgi:AhpC/TSA family
MHRRLFAKRSFASSIVTTALVVAGCILGSMPAVAVEVGQSAPDFKLPSTHGVDISLSEFRGKKWIFLEFYGGDFHPT